MTIRLTKGAVALVLSSVALLATPTFAMEPDVDSPAGPELPAPRTDRPDFQQDNQPGALLDPQVEGADPTPPNASLVELYDAPDVVIVPDD